MQNSDQKLCFKAGTRIFSIGENSTDTFIITKGEVRLSVEKNGQEITVDTIGENAIFGEMSLLVGGQRLVNATATKDTEVLPVSPEKLNNMIQDASPFVQALMRIMAKTVQKLTINLCVIIYTVK
jgi:CRP-like cAMP-binding protein